RGIEEVMNDVRDEIEKHIPGLQVELLQLMEDLIGDLTAVPQPIEIKLYSDDEQVLRTLPPRVADTISKIRGVVEVKNGIVPAGAGRPFVPAETRGHVAPLKRAARNHARRSQTHGRGDCPHQRPRSRLDGQ